MQIVSLDNIVLVFLILSFYSGWRKGLLRALVTPVSFLLSIGASMVYFDMHENIFIAFLVVTLGTPLLSFTCKILFFFARLTIDKEYRDHIFWLSRILGGVVKVAWRGTLVGIILTLLTLIPVNFPYVEDMTKSITTSRSYALSSYYVLEKITYLQNVYLTLKAFYNPLEIQQFSSSREFKEYFNDEKIQFLLKDPELQEAVKTKNYLQIVGNSSVRDVFTNDELMKKLARLYKKVYASRAKQSAQPHSK